MPVPTHGDNANAPRSLQNSASVCVHVACAAALVPLVPAAQWRPRHSVSACTTRRPFKIHPAWHDSDKMT